MTLFSTLKKLTNNEFVFTADEENPYDVKDWIDTGCMSLNAILSDGDINKGIPLGKRIMISGESGVAKSLFLALMIKAYLDHMKNSYVVFFESEVSTTLDMIEQIGIPKDRVLILPVDTVEAFREQSVQILDKIHQHNIAIDKHNNKVMAEIKMKKKGEVIAKLRKTLKTKENYIMVLDSLGNLGTDKEVGDAMISKRKQDMTRARLIKSVSRIISMKLALTQIPFLVVNHTYKQMSEYAEDEVGGGGGAKYMYDVSLVLTKAKEKDKSKKQIGIMITLKLRKSRYMKEGKTVKVLISFTRGVYRFSDLVNKAVELGVFKKEGKSYILPNIKDKVPMIDVRSKASQYIKGDTLELIRKAIMEDFGFGLEDGKLNFFDDMIEDDKNDDNKLEQD